MPAENSDIVPNNSLLMGMYLYCANMDILSVGNVYIKPMPMLVVTLFSDTLSDVDRDGDI